MASAPAQVLRMLERAERLGITPNTVMLNTALSALAKAGRPAEAAALFARIPAPDVASFETLLAAHGLAGQPAQAEVGALAASPCFSVPCAIIISACCLLKCLALEGLCNRQNFYTHGPLRASA